MVEREKQASTRARAKARVRARVRVLVKEEKAREEVTPEDFCLALDILMVSQTSRRDKLLCEEEVAMLA